MKLQIAKTTEMGIVKRDDGKTTLVGAGECDVHVTRNMTTGKRTVVIVSTGARLSDDAALVKFDLDKDEAVDLANVL